MSKSNRIKLLERAIKGIEELESVNQGNPCLVELAKAKKIMQDRLRELLPK
jgi:hypothetical protein